jgi:hypothetical protein
LCPAYMSGGKDGSCLLRWPSSWGERHRTCSLARPYARRNAYRRRAARRRALSRQGQLRAMPRHPRTRRHARPRTHRLGARRSPSYLRESLTDPDAAIPDSFSSYKKITLIPDNFLQIRVVTTDGRRLTGARVNEDTFSIQIRDAAGRIRSFFKEELRELHTDWASRRCLRTAMSSPEPSWRMWLPIWFRCEVSSEGSCCCCPALIPARGAGHFGTDSKL